MPHFPDGPPHRANNENDFSRIVDRYLPEETDITDKSAHQPSESEPVQRSADKRSPVQAILDLHGKRVDEARKAVDFFLKESAGKGLGKVLIIHGKGLHSTDGDSVLKTSILRYLEGHPLAGRREQADRRDGGSGATYVYIKRKPGI